MRIVRPWECYGDSFDGWVAWCAVHHPAIDFSKLSARQALDIYLMFGAVLDDARVLASLSAEVRS